MAGRSAPRLAAVQAGVSERRAGGWVIRRRSAERSGRLSHGEGGAAGRAGGSTRDGTGQPDTQGAALLPLPRLRGHQEPAQLLHRRLPPAQDLHHAAEGRRAHGGRPVLRHVLQRRLELPAPGARRLHAQQGRHLHVQGGARDPEGAAGLQVGSRVLRDPAY